MGHFVVLFLIVIQSTVFLGTATADCEFLAKSPKPPNSHLTSPIFANIDGNILYPERGAETLSIPSNQHIQISCSGRNIYTYKNAKQEKVGNNFLTAKCIGPHFSIDGINPSTQINNVFCMNYPVHRVYDLKQTCTTTDGRYGYIAAIGFETKPNKIIMPVAFCFDWKNLQNPGATQLSFYSQHFLSPLIETDKTETPSNFVPDSFNNLHGQKISDAHITSKLTETEEMNITSKFKPDNIYDLGDADIDKLYSKATQRKTINQLLGLPTNSDEVIKKDASHYLARGHLSPVADFYYKFEQEATYHFINVAPQWQCINNGNWKHIENEVRKYSVKGTVIETGNVGIMTLPHVVTKNPVPLYLYANNNERALPIPITFYKKYTDINRGPITVFLVNNPYLSVEYIESNIVHCPDISRHLTWLDLPTKHDPKLGYVFACYTGSDGVIAKDFNFTASSLL